VDAQLGLDPVDAVLALSVAYTAGWIYLSVWQKSSAAVIHPPFALAVEYVRVAAYVALALTVHHYLVAVANGVVELQLCRGSLRIQNIIVYEKLASFTYVDHRYYPFIFFTYLLKMCKAVYGAAPRLGCDSYTVSRT
jgi:hypothetical protein